MFNAFRNIQRNKYYFLLCAFIGFIFLPIMLLSFKKITGINLDLTLDGYFDKLIRPNFSKVDFINKKFQSNFENYFSEKFAPRGLFVKTYNQLQFSLFNKGNRIIGKNSYIFEEMYINDKLCLNGLDYNRSEKKLEMQNYVKYLVSIDKKLNKIGKKLFIYTTPSKAHLFKQNIPYKYLIQDKNGKRGIDCFRELAAELDLTYFDTQDLVKSSQYPVFYSTGIHWSRHIEQQASVEIVNRLRVLCEKNIATLKLGNINESKKPFYNESDVYDLLNLLFKTYDAKYYIYELNQDVPDDIEKFSVLLQGGSFSNGFLIDYCVPLENKFSDMIDYYVINYNNWLGHKQQILQNIKSDFSDMDFSFFDSIDCVVIEINEAAISLYSSGFAKWFDNFLDSYLEAHNGI